MLLWLFVHFGGFLVLWRGSAQRGFTSHLSGKFQTSFSLYLVSRDNVKIKNDKPQGLTGVSHETIETAVEMLLKWIKSKDRDQKSRFLPHNRHICLVLKLKTTHDSKSAIPDNIPVPHPLFHFDGSQNIHLIISGKGGLNAELAENKIKEDLPISNVEFFS